MSAMKLTVLLAMLAGVSLAQEIDVTDRRLVTYSGKVHDILYG